MKAIMRDARYSIMSSKIIKKKSKLRYLNILAYIIIALFAILYTVTITIFADKDTKSLDTGLEITLGFYLLILLSFWTMIFLLQISAYSVLKKV